MIRCFVWVIPSHLELETVVNEPIYKYSSYIMP